IPDRFDSFDDYESWQQSPRAHVEEEMRRESQDHSEANVGHEPSLMQSEIQQPEKSELKVKQEQEMKQPINLHPLSDLEQPKDRVEFSEALSESRHRVRSNPGDRSLDDAQSHKQTIPNDNESAKSKDGDIHDKKLVRDRTRGNKGKSKGPS